jgi:hypothetical protein
VLLLSSYGQPCQQSDECSQIPLILCLNYRLNTEDKDEDFNDKDSEDEGSQDEGTKREGSESNPDESMSDHYAGECYLT